LLSTLNSNNRKLNIILIGARKTGQAGVVLDVLSYYNNIKVLAFFDNTPEKKGETVFGIRVIGDVNEIEAYGNNTKIDAVHVAIGDNKSRYDIYKKLESIGIPPISIIHPTSIISPSAKIEQGCFIGAGAIIQNNSTIGSYSLINSGAIVEHDNFFGKSVQAAPNSCTAGRVKVGDFSFLGVSAIVAPDITIGSAVFIGAGVLIKKDVNGGLVMVRYSSKKHSKNIYLDLK
jgi:sugar O-acyltransferase (sialic acid O-acetyltransferase NeuD family)